MLKLATSKGAIWDEFSEQHQHQSLKKAICLLKTIELVLLWK